MPPQPGLILRCAPHLGRASKDECRRCAATCSLSATIPSTSICCGAPTTRYHVGSTRKTLDERIGEHNSGVYAGYTFTRRPVALVWSQDFPNAVDAIACERQLKGWSRAKKEALTRGDWKLVSTFARRRGGKPKR